MTNRRSVLVVTTLALPLLAQALHGGFTHLEAGSWSLRKTVRSVCNKGQGSAGYRLCLATAVSHPAKHVAIQNKLDDRCALYPQDCETDKPDVAKVKNCFNTVSVVNKSLPWRMWHAELFEDIMVGCLSKEDIGRVVAFATPGDPTGPFTEANLRGLLTGAISERKGLQSRIVSMCANFKK